MACCGVVVGLVVEGVAEVVSVVVRLGEVVGLGERLVVLRLEAALVERATAGRPLMRVCGSLEA